MRALITGASGFIGAAIVRRLAAEGVATRASARRTAADLPPGVEYVAAGDLGADHDWTPALSGVDAVVHTAARVHVMRETAPDALGEYRRVNVAGTLALARQAARAGVSRFVFLSSIKVNGERTAPGRPFTAADRPAPIDPYGISKLEAEEGLKVIGTETGMSIAVIRPVLVYGPGVKGNFLAMMRWLEKGVPLPLGAVDNRRSLCALDNLVDLAVTVMRHPNAAGATFLAADGEDLSTPELLRRTARAMDRRARLVPVPAGWLRLAGRITGRANVVERLVGTLQADISEARTRLDWSPPSSVDDALGATARHFLASAR